MIRTNTNNGILSNRNAMPQKDGVADGTSDFAQNRHIYERVSNLSANTNLEKKWVGNSLTASSVSMNRRAMAVGKGSINVQGQEVGYVSKEETSRREALRRVRSQGAIVPKKVSQKNVNHQISGAPVILSIAPGDTKAIVYFTAPIQTLNVSPGIISNYEYSIDEGYSWKLVAPIQKTSPLQISGLNNGTIYNIKIRAINNYAFSNASNSVEVVPLRNIPNEIAQMDIWLDSQEREKVTIVGGKVVNWNDKSSQLNDFITSTNPNQDQITNGQNDIINGRPALYFPIENQLMSTITKSRVNTNNVYSLFVVINQISYPSSPMNSEIFSATNFRIFDLFSNTQSVDKYLSTNMGYETQMSSDVNIMGSGPVIVSVIVSSTGYLYINGDITNINNMSKGSGIFYGMTANYGWRLSGAGFKGYIGEVIAYQSVVTTEERQKIEGYLAWKWNLQEKLLASHPYKNVAP